MRDKNKKNIVVVADDDLFVKKLIRAALQDFVEIIEVSDGACVEEIYKSHNPDIMLLDIHLPHRSGLELLPVILEADPQAFIVMLSADSSSNVVQTQQFGSRGFITKPFTNKRLLEVIQSCETIKFAD